METLNRIAAMVNHIRNLPVEEQERIIADFTAHCAADSVESSLYYAINERE